MKITFAILTAVVIGSGSVTGQTQDGIPYNATYDCPRSSVRNFRVLKCNSNGWCDVFYVNSSPDGGYKDELKKDKIQELLRIGCEIDGKPVKVEPQNTKVETATENNKTRETTAETTGDCSFNEPGGTVSKTAKASEALFKRVIFEQYRDKSNGRKVGLTYQTFQIGKSYVNRLTNNGLLHDGAPQGATIYAIKTKFTFCDKYTDSTIRWGYTAQYSCFKDKFGDWVCPSDSTKITEQTYLPND
jgi:hypothetical protein